MKKLILLLLFIVYNNFSYAQIMNKESILPFKNKLKKNNDVTNILLLGDSHIQADWLSGFLRNKFQETYGNAGRGLVFPYNIANSNGPEDFISSSDQTWENFRSTYEQNIFSEMGASGFVIGNDKNSFLEISFKNKEDYFDKVILFHDNNMEKESLNIYSSPNLLNNNIKRKTDRISYQVGKETFPELASKFYTTTTKLRLINGNSIQNPKPGSWIKVDKTSISINPNFSKNINLVDKKSYSNGITIVDYSNSQNTFLIQSNSLRRNIFYGFQFLKNVESGIVFNTVGINGATYFDFIKYPLQTKHLKTLNPDILIIALGTNESISSITKEKFKDNASTLINIWKKDSPNLPILLISPPDNKIRPNKVKEIANWIKEVANENNIAFIDLHSKMGGIGYFQKALQRKEANKDGVHFLKTGYEKQAEIIWKELHGYLNN